MYSRDTVPGPEVTEHRVGEALLLGEDPERVGGVARDAEHHRVVVDEVRVAIADRAAARPCRCP